MARRDHTVDQEQKDMREALSERAKFKKLSKAQINTFVDTNVTDIDSAKQLMKKMILIMSRTA